jgi:hypothetical protein
VFQKYIKSAATKKLQLGNGAEDGKASFYICMYGNAAILYLRSFRGAKVGIFCVTRKESACYLKSVFKKRGAIIRLSDSFSTAE